MLTIKNDLQEEALQMQTIRRLQHTYILCFDELNQCRSRLQLDEDFSFEGVTGVRVVSESDIQWLLKDQQSALLGFEKKFK